MYPPRLLTFFHTFPANSVQQSFSGVYFKIMMASHMICDLFHEVAVDVKQCAAFVAFEVKMFAALSVADKLVACGRVFIYNVFPDKSRSYEFIKLPVNGRHSQMVTL